ncbi:hypothetical protein [Clostridium sp. HBUAS56010]|uniref:hypothetical protein n=1 Tax=Clostridium sp. HBUAS56010 TaxID=2571127 RepID=UPI00117884D1|nr:hypothetical protein [Clostridium sp. HBUAS56010]
MEYIEIMLQDVNKKDVDLIIRQELNIKNDAVISSHFFNRLEQRDKEYEEINSLVNYFSIPNTGNVFIREITLGEKLYNVMVVMSFDEDFGDIILNFKEDDICNCGSEELKLKLKKVTDVLIMMQKKYSINNVMIGYESVFDNENVILKISNGHKEVINKFNGILSSVMEVIQN